MRHRNELWTSGAIAKSIVNRAVCTDAIANLHFSLTPIRCSNELTSWNHRIVSTATQVSYTTFVSYFSHVSDQTPLGLFKGYFSIASRTRVRCRPISDWNRFTNVTNILLIPLKPLYYHTTVWRLLVDCLGWAWWLWRNYPERKH